MVGEVFQFTRPFHCRFFVTLLFDVTLSLIGIITPQVVRVCVSSCLTINSIAAGVDLFFTVTCLKSVLLGVLIACLRHCVFDVTSRRAIRGVQGTIFHGVGRLKVHCCSAAPTNSVISHIAGSARAVGRF